MNAATVVLTLGAGAVGAVLRAALIAVLPRSGLRLVNVAGTLVLAVGVALAGAGRLVPDAAAIVGLGFAGSLTTFSGWVAAVEDGLGIARARTVVLDVLLPLAAGVVVTVAVLIALG